MSIERTDLANIEYRAKTGEFLVDRCACGRRMQPGFPNKAAGQGDRCYSCAELTGAQLSTRIRRAEYPSDGALVERIVRNRNNGIITILYDDNTYLTVERKVACSDPTSMR